MIGSVFSAVGARGICCFFVRLVHRSPEQYLYRPRFASECLVFSEPPPDVFPSAVGRSRGLTHCVGGSCPPPPPVTRVSHFLILKFALVQVRE